MGPIGEVVSNSSCDNLSNRAEIKPQEQSDFFLHSIDLTPSDQVCNIVGSSRDKPRGATSWKKYWEIKTGEKWPSQCSIWKLFEKCRGIGGHMYIKSKPNIPIILPICTSCNNKRSIDYNAYSPNKTAWTRIVQITTAVPIWLFKCLSILFWNIASNKKILIDSWLAACIHSTHLKI